MFAVAAAGLALAGGAAAQTALETTTIDFESLKVPKTKQGVGALALSKQFAARGLVFAGACAVDLSTTGANWKAHSGVKVAVRCRPAKKTRAVIPTQLLPPLTMEFAKPVQDLSLWVTPLGAERPAGSVRLIAFNSKNAVVARTAIKVGPGLKPGSWRQFGVKIKRATIARAQISASAPSLLFAIDDVKFARPLPGPVRMGHANDPWNGPHRPINFVRKIAPISTPVAVAALTPIPLPEKVVVPPPSPPTRTVSEPAKPVPPPPQKPDWWPWIAGALGLSLAGAGGSHWYRMHLRARVSSRIVSRSDPLPVSTDEGAALSIGIALVAGAGPDAPGTKITITPNEDDDGRA